MRRGLIHGRFCGRLSLRGAASAGWHYRQKINALVYQAIVD
jgi:hypothetical protein